LGVKALTPGMLGESRLSGRCLILARSAVIVLLAGVLAAPAGWMAAEAAGPEWAGEWVVWEGYQTGEETTVRLEAYPATLGEFEAALPAWAERLRGLCDPAGRYYVGSADDVEVLACEPSGHASGLWREAYLLLGAMSGHIGALAPDPDLSLFGIGSESAERAPFQTSPSGRYFWGHTITRTPTAEEPQGNSNTAGANDWHGRCMRGPCAAGAAAGTTSGGTTATTSPPTLDEELARIRIESTGMECDNPPATDIYLLAARTPTRDREWFGNRQNISPVERIVAVVGPGTMVTVPEGVEVEIYGPEAWGYLRGPAVGRVQCPDQSTVAETVWDLLQGKGVFDWNESQGELTVGTPYVVTGVLGTRFIVDVSEQETRVVVLEGTVEVTGVIAGTQVVTAGHEAVADGDSVAAPQPTDPANLTGRYPWLDDALQALAEPLDLTGLDGDPEADDPANACTSSFPIWPVVIAAALALLSLGGFARIRVGKRGSTPQAPPPPPPSPEVEAIQPPPPPP
jgi:hypothetical protein